MPRARPEPMPRTVRRRSAGFTIVELMIAVLVVGVLLAVALPSFRDSLRKSRRSDAINAISAVQQAQERVRANWPQYCGTLAAPSGGNCGLDLPGTTSNGHYTLALSDVGQTGYTVTATAAGGQAADTNCAKLAFKMDRGATSYGSGSSSVDWSDPHKCWAK